MEHFASLPGVGEKTALRFVLNLLKRDEEEIKSFSAALSSMYEKITSCELCGNISDSNICHICQQPNRKREIVCVVEDIRDILAIENTQHYAGLYHVLGGVISPMEGVGPSDLNVDRLIERIREGGVKEVILGLSTSMEGDTTNFFLYRKLEQFDLKITTLSRGVAIGTELQYADELTLGRSILNRTPFGEHLIKK